MNVVTKALTPIFTLHLMDADRVKVANALRATLPKAYEHWISDSSPMDSNEDFSLFEGSFPIRSMEELVSLVVALVGVVCDKWLHVEAQDADASCKFLLMRDCGRAEWTCEMASISRQFDEALTQIERVISAARTSHTPVAPREEAGE